MLLRHLALCGLGLAWSCAHQRRPATIGELPRVNCHSSAESLLAGVGDLRPLDDLKSELTAKGYEIVKAELEPLPNDEWTQIVRYAFTDQRGRERGAQGESDHLSFYAHKNTSNPKPLVFFMGGFKSERVSEELLQVDWLRRAYLEYPPTTTEYRMLRLRKGDYVDYDGRRFRLGRFLAAGNATHIYEIEGRSDAVLRLPFLVAGLVTRSHKAETPAKHLDKARLYIQHFATHMGQMRNGVKILEVDPKSRFIMVERLHPEFDGAQYIRAKLGINVEAEKTLEQSVTFVSEKLKTKAIKDERLLKLFCLMRANGHFPKIDLPEDLLKPEWVTWIREASVKKVGFDKSLLGARQYVWDTKRLDWVLADTL
jgi:hypothetical protein